jgi:diacylglycerol kinase family enzyme
VPRSAVLIHNPGSGQRRDRFQSVTRMVDALRGRGITVTPQVTTGPADATRLTAAAAARTDGVVHGGDGTVNEAMQPWSARHAARGVWGHPACWPRAGLPGGTILADVFAAERTRRVSVGRAGERYFLLMAGIGLDADIVRAVHPGLKRLTGEGAYWMAGLRQLTDWHPAHFVLETDAGRHSATFAVVANAASYGGGLRFAPDARMDDDVLDICLFDSTQRHRFARYLAAAFSGSHLGMPGVTYVKARRAVVHGDPSCFVQVDGELLGPLPVSFECVPEALSLVVP